MRSILAIVLSVIVVCFAVNQLSDAGGCRGGACSIPNAVAPSGVVVDDPATAAVVKHRERTRTVVAVAAKPVRVAVRVAGVSVKVVRGVCGHQRRVERRAGRK